ncbi:MAG TPA: hypothetical protein VK722_03375 [Candidatus Aquilonibacter sp.]|jgi:hypothetical protein|nr:hypothetical protein [Candidatus Aquilonibacter sp.]
MKLLNDLLDHPRISCSPLNSVKNYGTDHIQPKYLPLIYVEDDSAVRVTGTANSG